MMKLKRMKKKAMIFNITIVVLTIVVLVYGFIRFSEKMDVGKEIGESQLALIGTVQEGEKALIFLDFAAKMAVYQAVYDLQSRGGISESSVCGSYYGFNRWNSDSGESCFVDSSSAKDAFRDLFVSNLVARAAKYPSADFVGNVQAVNFRDGVISAVGVPSSPSEPQVFSGPTIQEGDVELTEGYHGIYTLAMTGGDPYIRAFMRMITWREGAPGPVNGVTPYRVLVGGTVVSDPEARAFSIGNRNFFNGYNGHPKIMVEWSGSRRSSAAGRYQFLGSTWYNAEKNTGWALDTPNGASDFSPGNQDLAVYIVLERKGISQILQQAGPNPDPASQSFGNIWQKIMAPSHLPTSNGQITDRGENLMSVDGGNFGGVPGGKDIGGIWASLPYGCYSNQGCSGRDSQRFRETADAYVNLLIEELAAEGQQAVV